MSSADESGTLLLAVSHQLEGEAKTSRGTTGPAPARAECLERYTGAQLDLPRTQCGSDLAERPVTECVVHRPEVHAIENIQEVEAELQAPLFAQPRQVGILQNGGIHLKQAGI